MHMKQSPYQLHPQQFLSSSSSFYIMLHMCILWCVSSFFADEDIYLRLAKKKLLCVLVLY